MSLIELTEGETCLLCRTSTIDKLKYGSLYKLENVTAHYYCVLLSSQMQQKGNDDDGLLGFLLSDIRAELRRCRNIRCCYCKAGGATIQCCQIKCRRIFHLPCGLKFNTMHQFFEQFQSFCHKHRSVQNIPNHILEEAEKIEICCYICFETVNIKDKIGTLWAPCCKRTWYHKICVQKMALSAGYFFKCAKCSDQEKFPKCMQQFGVYIPQQDASWELEPNAFEDLHFRYNNCDALVCRCPYGRDKSFKKTSWEIVLCESCGSQGIHKVCGNLKLVKPEWECSVCRSVSKKKKLVDITGDRKSKTDNDTIQEIATTTTSTTQNQRRRKRSRFSENSEKFKNSLLEKRKKMRYGDEYIYRSANGIETHKEVNGVESDSSEEILDVETVETTNQSSNVHEVLSKIKPGPLSYKLALIRKEIGYSSKPTDEELVDLISDSDSNPDTDSDVEVVELNNSLDEGGNKEKDDGGVTLVWEKKAPKVPDKRTNLVSSSSGGSSGGGGKGKDLDIINSEEEFTILDDDVATTDVVLPRQNTVLETKKSLTRMVSVIVSGVEKTISSLKVNIERNNRKEPPPVG